MAEQGRRKGLILKSQGGFYQVRTPEGDFACQGRGIFRKTNTVLLVGDRVEIEPHPTGKSGEGTIVALEPRKNSLKRPPIANIDRLVAVASTVSPAPNLLVIDKMTAIAALRGVDVVVVFTKVDLQDPGETPEIYRRAGFPVFTVDSMTGEGTQALRTLFSTGITAFSGNSGAGKSSLLNAIFPGLQLATGEVSKKLGRGRHTTRHVELFPVGEGYIADTPGFSAVDFMQSGRMMAGDLAPCFIEFRPYIGKCRFNGCSHRVEKDCAVLEAVAAGQIPPSRHQSYCTIYEELGDVKEWELKEGRTP